MEPSLTLVLIATVATLVIQIVKLVKRSSCWGCSFETRRTNSNASLLEEENNKE